jgi:hypothetical protein
MSRRSHVTTCFITTEWNVIARILAQGAYLRLPCGVREAWHLYLKSIADLFKASLYESWRLPLSYHKVGYSSIILTYFQHFGLGIDFKFILLRFCLPQGQNASYRGKGLVNFKTLQMRVNEEINMSIKHHYSTKCSFILDDITLSECHCLMKYNT